MKKITVKAPKVFVQLSLFICFIFIVIMVLERLFGKPPYLPMVVIIILLIIIPFGSIAIYYQLFRVTLKNDIITVRKGNGRKYSFNISDIDQVIIKIAESDTVHTERTIIKAKKKKVTIENIMKNYKKMHNYIIENVDDNIIETRKKDLRKKTREEE